MNDSSPDILVQRFVDGDLSDAEVEQALHRIADDAEARDLLQFELRMTQDLAATRSGTPSADFASRTMDLVAREHAPTEAEAPSAQLWSWWAALTAPRTLRLRPASALMIVLLAGIAMVGVLTWTMDSARPAAEPGQPASPTVATSAASEPVQRTSTQGASASQTVWVRFLYPNSDADSVAVAGDFSRWEPVPLSPRTVDGKTVWTGLVPVSPGEHEYQFLINGDRWVTDPLAPVKRSDGFGAKNAVLNV